MITSKLRFLIPAVVLLAFAGGFIDAAKRKTLTQEEKFKIAIQGIAKKKALKPAQKEAQIRQQIDLFDSGRKALTAKEMVDILKAELGTDAVAAKIVKELTPAPADPAIAARAELKTAIANAQTDLLKIASDITGSLKQAGGPLSKAGGMKLLTAVEKAPAYNDAKKALLDVLIDKSEVAGKKLLKLEAGKKKAKEVEKVDLSSWIKGLDKADAEAAKADVEKLAVDGKGDIEAAANNVATEAYKAAASKLVKLAEDKVGDDTKPASIEGRVDAALKDADNNKTLALKTAYDTKMGAVTAAMAEAKKFGAAGYAEAKKLDGLVDALEIAAKAIENDKKGHKPPPPPGADKIIVSIQFDDGIDKFPDPDPKKIEVSASDTDTDAVIAEKIKAALTGIDLGGGTIVNELLAAGNIASGAQYPNMTIIVNWGKFAAKEAVIKAELAK